MKRRASMNEATRIVASTPALMLATVASDGAPQASYVPFVPVDGGLGIAVSGLAAHTHNLLARPRCSVLVASEEPVPDGSYARPRISIDVIARRATPDSVTALAVWSALARRHGPIAVMLRELPDFVVFTLEPLRARLILGFAAAHDLDGRQTLQQIRNAQQLDDSP